jgi:2OG-Fe(II) oxygenase superfamily
MMLQLTKNGLVLEGELDTLRERFSTNHCVVLEKLLEPALLENVQRRIEQAKWRNTTYENVGTEFTLEDPVAIHILLFLLNRSEFLDAIRVITGCEEITDFLGRVYRLTAGPQSQLSWHTDIDNSVELRHLALSINLSSDVYSGGTFELRDRVTKASLAQINNTGFGDALLFRVSNNLEHRVTEVVDKVAKTAFAGWFRATGVSLFADLVRQSANTSMAQSGQH